MSDLQLLYFFIGGAIAFGVGRIIFHALKKKRDEAEAEDLPELMYVPPEMRVPEQYRQCLLCGHRVANLEWLSGHRQRCMEENSARLESMPLASDTVCPQCHRPLRKWDNSVWRVRI